MSRAWKWLVDALAAAGGLIIAAVCLLIIYDVVARNLGLQPPASTVALTEYALLYFTMAAAPWLVRNKGHIVVESVYRQATPALQAKLDRVIAIFCILTAFTVALLATVLTIEAWQRGEIEVRSLDMPRWALFAPLAVGFFMMSIEFLRLLLRRESVFGRASDSVNTL